MKKLNDENIVFIIYVGSIIIISLLISFIRYNDGYKQGTIDALTGKAEYQLVTMPDSTRIWEEIK